MTGRNSARFQAQPWNWAPISTTLDLEYIKGPERKKFHDSFSVAKSTVYGVAGAF